MERKREMMHEGKMGRHVFLWKQEDLGILQMKRGR